MRNNQPVIRYKGHAYRREGDACMEPIGHGIVRTIQDSTLLVVIVGLFRYFCPVLQHWLHRFQLWCWQSVCEVHVEDATVMSTRLLRKESS